jgi:hypothetical protein
MPHAGHRQAVRELRDAAAWLTALWLSASTLYNKVGATPVQCVKRQHQMQRLFAGSENG